MMYGRFKCNAWIASDTYEDMFGARCKVGTDGGDIGAPCNRVITELGAGAYQVPDLDPGLIDAAAREVAADSSRFRMFRLTYALFERAWSLAGMEALLAGMLADPAATAEPFGRITEFNLRVLDVVLPHGVEGVYVGDDWGTQHGLIEIGMDAYSTVQPEIYDLSKLKRDYGKHLIFWGGISTQQFLPFATPAQVTERCSQAIRLLGNGGGYIFAPTHAVTPDIPVENVQAMLECVRVATWRGKR